MIRHIWSALCERAVVNKDTNNVSLFEVLEEVQVSVQASGEGGSAPLPMRIMWVTTWMREPVDEPQQGQARDVVVNPSGREILRREYAVDLSTVRRLRANRTIEGLPVVDSGTYWFSTQVWDARRDRWQTVGQTPLDIRLDFSGEET
jgi:hypothetical protein